MDNVQGKVAVITGAASGIGLAVAKRAAADGMKVVLADIEERALGDAARTLAATGAEVLAVVTDVSDGSAVEALRDRTLERFGAVHLVHNNAGVEVGGPLWAVSESQWRWILGVNLWGVIHGIRVFVPLLIKQAAGHVVNTASLAGLSSPALMGPYNATKHGVVTISETLYRDLQLKGSPVGVSVLCPGYVRTGIAESHRNRPTWVDQGDSALAERGHAAARQFVEGGIAAEIVAEAVLDAVRANRFYIMTHPQTNAIVGTRMHEILEGRSPTPLPPSFVVIP